jgi:hypothetical protein
MSKSTTEASRLKSFEGRLTAFNKAFNPETKQRKRL